MSRSGVPCRVSEETSICRRTSGKNDESPCRALMAGAQLGLLKVKLNKLFCAHAVFVSGSIAPLFLLLLFPRVICVHHLTPQQLTPVDPQARQQRVRAASAANDRSWQPKACPQEVPTLSLGSSVRVTGEVKEIQSEGGFVWAFCLVLATLQE